MIVEATGEEVADDIQSSEQRPRHPQQRGCSTRTTAQAVNQCVCDGKRERACLSVWSSYINESM